MADPVATRVRVGCAGLAPGLRRERYFQRLAYLEVDGTFRRLPKRAALRRWREAAPEGAGFGLIAPRLITHAPRTFGRDSKLTETQRTQGGEFRDTPVVREAVARFADAVAAVGAEAVVFRVAPQFAPSAAHRERVRQFFAEIAPAEAFPTAQRVLEPQGLWELATAAKLADELGLVCACDPIPNDPLFDPASLESILTNKIGYLRVSGLGQANPRLDDYAIETLLEYAESFERVWLVLAHPGKYPDAIGIHRILWPTESES